MSSKSTGRRLNPNFSKLGFDFVKVNNKPAAKCRVCGNVVKNTGALRLQSHRNICKSSKTTNAEREVILVDVPDRENITDQDQPTNENNELAVVAVAGSSKENESVSISEYEVMQDGSLVLTPTTTPTSSKSDRSVFNRRAVFDVSDTSSIISDCSMEVQAAQRMISPTSNNPTQSSDLNNIDNNSRPSISPQLKKRLLSPNSKRVSSKKKKPINEYIDILHEKEEEKINDALAQLVFGCNLPFSIVESPLFKNFIKTIRPAYAEKIPGRKRLSTTLLEKCYNNCIENTCKKIKEDAVILCDGWKNSSNNTKTVVTLLQSVDGESAFIDAWDLTTQSETAEELASIITQSREIAKNKYNVDAYAIVSDNASAMVKMGSLLKHAMWHTTCNSHTGNLLAKDILNKKLTDNVLIVLKEFKQPDFEKNIVLQGGNRIKLPAETRWCSYRDSFKSLLDNLQFMKQIVASTKKKIKPKITELIFDDDFIDEVQKNLELHDPICELINTCQKADTSVADAVHLWLNLELPEAFKDKLKHRQEMSLNTYSLTAYYLHPTYDNSKLSKVQKGRVNAFLFKTLNKQGIEEWDKFNTKSGIFTTLFEKEVVEPLLFWRMAKMDCPLLAEIALKLLRIPASSAQIERLFSNWGHVHNLLRNRLTFDNSKKLVHIYFSLKSQFPQDLYELDIEQSSE